MSDRAVSAPAKINLSLHVTGVRPDGYHLLDSLVVFADVGDRLWFEDGPERTIEVTGPFADGVPADAGNLIWQAAEALGWTGHIRVEKNLPHGAGIGGGSADAAAALRTLADPEDPALPQIALALGADVPVCLSSQSQRMRGIGEELSLVSLPSMPALLVNPGISVPTRDVFARLAIRENAPMPEDLPEFAKASRFAHWLRHQRNDLECPALGVARVIEEVLGDLNMTASVQLARMSGSGATCFALYPTLNAAKFAAYEIEAAHPDWWVRPCTLG